MDKLLMIEKMGHSSDNIIEIQNVIGKEDHGKLLLDCKNLKFLSGSKDPNNFWYKRIAFNNEMNKDTMEILEKIFIVAKKEIQLKYNIKVKLKSTLYSITLWKPGMSMLPHSDDVNSKPDLKIKKQFQFAALFYINDNYSGGELNFTNLNKIIKPKENSLVIFPAYPTYTHEVKTIIDGYRYTSTNTFIIEQEDAESFKDGR